MWASRHHVTSSVMWPLDSQCGVSYGWSIVTICISCTVMEIWSGIGAWYFFAITTVTFWVHGLAMSGFLRWSIVTICLSCMVVRYGAPNIFGSQRWLLGLCDVIAHVTSGLTIDTFTRCQSELAMLQTTPLPPPDNHLNSSYQWEEKSCWTMRTTVYKPASLLCSCCMSILVIHAVGMVSARLCVFV